MDGRREIVDGEQVIVEEIVDEGEVYDELVLGEEGEAIYLDGEEIDVEDLEPGEYIQLPGGRLIPASQHASAAAQDHMVQRPPIHRPQMQPRRPMQNENHGQAPSQVYAIRGNQVFRVDKNAQGGSELKPTAFKAPKPDPDGPVVPSSVSTQQGTNRQHFGGQSFRRDSSYGPFHMAATAMSKQKKKVMTGGLRKPCNCTKSMCLKLYCECFANGEFCRDCNCKDCHNNLQHEQERTRAIKSSLERNPNAFKPKIVSGMGAKGRTDLERLHMKGCHCKKSNCLKNYCECYEAKVACTDRCKCCGCKNTENDRATKFRDRLGPTALLSLANVATLADNRTSTPFSDDESEGEGEEKSDPKTMPWFYLTDEVVEASTLCLVAQAEQLERSESEVADDLMERMLMAEFSHCLQSIISSASDAAAAAKAAIRQQKNASPISSIVPEPVAVTPVVDS